MLNSHRNWFYRFVDRAILYFSDHDSIDGLPFGTFDDKKEAGLRFVAKRRERQFERYRLRRAAKKQAAQSDQSST